MLRTSAINLVLKIGLAVSGIVFAILSFLVAPDIIVLYPHFIISLVGEIVTLALGAATALILSVWLLSRKHKFASAFTFFIFVSLGMLFNITSLSFISIAWPLFCMSLALCLRYYPRVRVIFSDKKGNEKMKIVPAILADEAEETGVQELKNQGLSEQGTKQAGKNSYGDETPFEENESGNDFAHKFATASNAYMQDLLATPITTFKDFRAQFDHPIDSINPAHKRRSEMPEEQILVQTYENEDQAPIIDLDPYESELRNSTIIKDDLSMRHNDSSEPEYVKPAKESKMKHTKKMDLKPRVKIAKAPRIKAIKHRDDDVIAYDEPESHDEYPAVIEPKKVKRQRKPKTDLL